MSVRQRGGEGLGREGTGRGPGALPPPLCSPEARWSRQGGGSLVAGGQWVGAVSPSPSSGAWSGFIVSRRPAARHAGLPGGSVPAPGANARQWPDCRGLLSGLGVEVPRAPGRLGKRGIQGLSPDELGIDPAFLQELFVGPRLQRKRGRRSPGQRWVQGARRADQLFNQPLGSLSPRPGSLLGTLRNQSTTGQRRYWHICNCKRHLPAQVDVGRACECSRPPHRAQTPAHGHAPCGLRVPRRTPGLSAAPQPVTVHVPVTLGA